MTGNFEHIPPRRMHQYLVGELAQEQVGAVDAHTSDCVICEEELLLIQALEYEFANAEPKTVPDDFFAGLQKAIAEDGPEAKPKSRKRLWTAGLAAAAAIVTAVLIGNNIGWEAPGAQVVLESKQGQVLSGGKPAAIGAAITSGEQVETGKQAAATIAYGNLARIKLKSKVKIKFIVISPDLDSPRLQLNQSRGAVKYSVVPKTPVWNVQITTPHATIAVIGTQFAVLVNDKETLVQVLKGRVLVNGLADKNEVTLEAGRQISIKSQTGMVEPLSIEEKSKLKDWDPAVPLNQPDDEPVNLEKPEPKKKLTVSDLKKKYGKLTKVTMKSGVIYIGPFKIKGQFMYVTTVNGVKKIKQADVAKMEPYE